VIHFELDQGVKKSFEMTRLINESLGQSPPAHDALESGEPQGESPTSESPGEPGPSATGGPGESETPVTGGEE
jgi:hypothetical protein